MPPLEKGSGPTIVDVQPIQGSAAQVSAASLDDAVPAATAASFDNTVQRPLESESRPTIVDIQPARDNAAQMSAISLDDAVQREAPLEPEPGMTPAPIELAKRRFITGRRSIGVGLLIVGLILGVFVVIRTNSANKQQAAQAALANASTQIKVQSIPLPTLSKQLGSNSQQTNTLTVNGQVKISNSLVLQATTQPDSPVAGQIYFNGATNQLGYFDGKGYVYLSGAASSTVNNYTINNITNQAPTTNVTNIYQGGGVTALNGITGDIAMFTGSNTLSDSLINQSDTTLNVATGSAGTVNIGSPTDTSTTNVQGGTGGVSINTGSSTGSSGNITIESGGSSTTASGNITIDTGPNFVTGTVVADYGFEDGTDGLTSWSGSPTVAQDCTVARTGSCSLAVNGGAFWAILANENDQNYIVPITAGHHYYVSVWVRAATGTTPISGALMWDIGQFDTSYMTIPTVNTTTTGWTQMTATGIAPAGANQGIFRFGGIGGTSNGTQYFDDITVTDLSSGSASSDLDVGSSNAQEITIGNMNETEPTTIDGGSGINVNAGAANININGGAITMDGTGASSFGTDSGSLTLSAGGDTGGGVIVQTQTPTTTAFQVQGSDTNLLTVDSTDNEISLGTGAGSALGYTGDGPWDGGGITGSISAQKVTTTAAGSITSISAYIGTEASPDNLFQFALYADDGSGSAPGSYITSSAVGTMGSAIRDWYTLPIPSTALTANTTYWLVYWQNWPGSGGTDNSFIYSPGGSGSLSVSGTSTWQAGVDNGMPATFPSVAFSSSSVASLYASYASSGPALTIDQYGTFTQDGAALFQDPSSSTVAFQVQDGLGNPLLTVDTADEIVDVSVLSVAGDITVNGHIVSGGGTPGIAAGAAACTSPTVAVSGTDTSGTITITTGTGCSTSGVLGNITFANNYGATPHISLTPGGSNALTLGAYVNDATAADTGFSIGTNTTPANSTTYTWNYQVIQ